MPLSLGQGLHPRLDQSGQASRQPHTLQLGHVKAAPLAHGDDAAL